MMATTIAPTTIADIGRLLTTLENNLKEIGECEKEAKEYAVALRKMRARRFAKRSDIWALRLQLAAAMDMIFTLTRDRAGFFETLRHYEIDLVVNVAYVAGESRISHTFTTYRECAEIMDAIRSIRHEVQEVMRLTYDVNTFLVPDSDSGWFMVASKKPIDCAAVLLSLEKGMGSDDAACLLFRHADEAKRLYDESFVIHCPYAVGRSSVLFATRVDAEQGMRRVKNFLRRHRSVIPLEVGKSKSEPHSSPLIYIPSGKVADFDAWLRRMALELKSQHARISAEYMKHRNYDEEGEEEEEEEDMDDE
jgi:hypothetical protein